MKLSAKILLLFVLCSIFALLSFTSNDKKRIVIDAGHGGKDYGAVEGGHWEKDLVRKIALQVTEANTNYDYEFLIIGEEDRFIDLEQRVKAINSLNPDVLISLHLGSSSDTKMNGANAYVSPKNKELIRSHKIAEKLLISLSDDKNITEVIEKDLFVLKNVNCPAVTLEIGYLSNPSDREALLSEEGQREIGKKIAASLSDF